MKNSLLYAALASLAIMSCTKTEVASDGYAGRISFDDFVHRTTKAVQADADAVRQNGFSVSAYYNASEDSHTWYFRNLEVSYDNSGFNTAYYWPMSGTMDFYAVYPKGKVVTEAAAIENYTTNGYEDLMIAKTMGEDCDSHNAVSSNVNLEFRHVLTQIYFSAKGAEASNRYLITGITIQAKDNSSYEFRYSWTTPASPRTYTYSNSSQSFTGNESHVYGSKEANSLMLIPQSGATVKVEYQVYTTDDVLIVSYTGENAKTFTAGSWEPGKTILYDLTLPLGANPVVLSASVVNWNDAAGDTAL